MDAMSVSGADDFLLEQVRRGDQEAWRQLIERYSGRLLAFARTRAPSLADAEDLVQETLVGFIQSMTYYDPNRSLETYLFTILRHKLYDQFRQRRVTTVAEPADADDWWDQVLPGDPETPSGIALQAEARQQQETILVELLRALIAELRDRQAFEDLQVIELIFYAGTRNLEIAELLDIDQKAVAGIKFRAIQKLQKYLEARDIADRAMLNESQADVTVARVWREHRLTCLKRSTLGSYLLGVLDDPWRGYTQFHLDVVACPLCLANLADLEAEKDATAAPQDRERYFQSSVGFLKHSSP